MNPAQILLSEYSFSEKEKKELFMHKKSNSSSLVRNRVEIIYLVSLGYDMEDICKITKYKEAEIVSILEMFKHKGIFPLLESI